MADARRTDTDNKTMMIRKLFMLLIVATAFLGIGAENYPYRSDVLWVTTPDHADWLYKVGEKASVEVQLYHYGIPQDVEVRYTLAADMREAHDKGSVMLKNGRAIIKLGTRKTPGFTDCKLSATIGDKTFEHHVKVGFSPEKLQPYTKDLSDFDDFWKRNIDEVKDLPFDVESRLIEEYCTPTTLCYLVRINVDKGKHVVYGYLTRPRAEGKYPVVLCPPGAGIKTIKEPMRHIYYAQNNFVRLEMEIHGLNPEISNETFKEISNAFNAKNNGYLENRLDNRDNYYMKHVYQGCYRAMDYLMSLDCWDGKNAAVQGGSQGGALAIITATLHPQVTLCVANHPALSDMAGYLGDNCGGYPHFNRSNDMLTPEKVKVMSYYDVVNFARRLKAKTYITWGYNDNVCPPTTSYIVYNVISAPKEALITPINEHWTSELTEHRLMEWIKRNLKQ
jgi:cephalosporin-C deacetylase-like acetyl esterase